MKFEIKGLYAITDTANLSSEIMLTRTEEILRAGAKLLQYRNKQADEDSRLKEANQLLDLCRQYSVPLIINDDIALTVQTGADGVHLGKTDSTIADARECLGNSVMIGCSCYNDLDRAQQAQPIITLIWKFSWFRLHTDLRDQCESCKRYRTPHSN